MTAAPFNSVQRQIGLLLKVALAAALLGSIVYAHGCHRHEDNELFTAWIAGN